MNVVRGNGFRIAVRGDKAVFIAKLGPNIAVFLIDLKKDYKQESGFEIDEHLPAGKGSVAASLRNSGDNPNLRNGIFGR